MIKRNLELTKFTCSDYITVVYRYRQRKGFSFTERKGERGKDIQKKGGKKIKKGKKEKREKCEFAASCLEPWYLLDGNSEPRCARVKENRSFLNEY